MSADQITIARPYAEAVFSRAQDTDTLDLWTEMLGFLSVAVQDPALSGLITSPKLDRPRMAELILEIAGGRLNDEGQNLVRLLAANRRLGVLPEIANLFELRKAEHEGTIDVVVTSAFELKPAQEKQLAEALKRKLGRDVRISSAHDPELIGGFRLRAGDIVVDGSVAGRLTQLAHELGI